TDAHSQRSSNSIGRRDACSLAIGRARAGMPIFDRRSLRNLQSYRAADKRLLPLALDQDARCMRGAVSVVVCDSGSDGGAVQRLSERLIHDNRKSDPIIMNYVEG